MRLAESRLRDRVGDGEFNGDVIVESEESSIHLEIRVYGRGMKRGVFLESGLAACQHSVETGK